MNRKVLTVCAVLALTLTSGTVMAAESRPMRITAPRSPGFSRDIERPGFASGAGFELRLREPADMAEEFGIDVSGMTDEEIRAALAEQMEAKRLEALKAALVDKGVDVTGLSEEELFQAARENDMMFGGGRGFRDGFGMLRCTPERLAESLGIDISGMTDEQIADAVSGAVRGWCLEWLNDDSVKNTAAEL